MTIKHRSYNIKSYFNASHAVRWENGQGKQHNHTWEVVCELSTEESMVSFSDIEKSLRGVLDEFSGQFLNELPEFTVINPTVENVAEHLFVKVDDVLRENDAKLLRLELSDSPTRAYCIDVTGRTMPD